MFGRRREFVIVPAVGIVSIKGAKMLKKPLSRRLRAVFVDKHAFHASSQSHSLSLSLSFIHEWPIATGV